MNLSTTSWQVSCKENSSHILSLLLLECYFTYSWFYQHSTFPDCFTFAFWSNFKLPTVDFALWIATRQLLDVIRPVGLNKEGVHNWTKGQLSLTSNRLWQDKFLSAVWGSSLRWGYHGPKNCNGRLRSL